MKSWRRRELVAPRKGETVHEEAVRVGLMCGVVAEHETDLGLLKRQEGCQEEEGGGLALEWGAGEGLQVTK